MNWWGRHSYSMFSNNEIMTLRVTDLPKAGKELDRRQRYSNLAVRVEQWSWGLIPDELFHNLWTVWSMSQHFYVSWKAAWVPFSIASKIYQIPKNNSNKDVQDYFLLKTVNIIQENLNKYTRCVRKKKTYYSKVVSSSYWSIYSTQPQSESQQVVSSRNW